MLIMSSHENSSDHLITVSVFFSQKILKHSDFKTHEQKKHSRSHDLKLP